MTRPVLKRPVLWASVGAVAVLWLLSITSYVVSETEQALIIRLGAPAGLVSTTMPASSLSMT